jgi:hypothetical protein
MGIGFAASRDWISFLRYQTRDDEGNPNPIAGIKQVLSFGASQTGRVSREFVYLGFNEDESVPGRRVLDGMDIALAATRPFVNFRFGRPTQLADLQHEGLFFPTSAFPFAYEDQTDPFSGKGWHPASLHGDRPARIYFHHQLPRVRVFKIHSAYRPLGTWTYPSTDVRGYLFRWAASTVPSDSAPGRASSRPTFLTAPLLRSLLVALHDWVEDGTERGSRVPSADGTWSGAERGSRRSELRCGPSDNRPRSRLRSSVREELSGSFMTTDKAY